MNSTKYSDILGHLLECNARSVYVIQYCCYLIAFRVGSSDIISLRIFSIIAQFSGVNNVIASVSNMVKA